MFPPLTGPLESDIFQGPELTPDERTEELARSQHSQNIRLATFSPTSNMDNVQNQAHCLQRDLSRSILDLNEDELEAEL